MLSPSVVFLVNAISDGFAPSKRAMTARVSATLSADHAPAPAFS
jgi:hypothetical protein